MTPTADRCRAYLLGQLPTVDAERLEEQLLEDAEVFAAVREAESDLLDDWARGRLTADEGERVLARFGHEPDRLAFARALAVRARAARRLARRVPPRAWVPLAAAAALAAAVGGAYLARTQRPVATPSTARVVEAPPPASPGPVVVALIALGTSRAAAADTRIAVPPDAAAVEIRVRLDPADRFERYAMELRSASNAVIWRADDLRVTSTNGDLVLVGRIASATVPTGSYELSVRGASASGALEDLGFVTVAVTHPR